MTSTRRTIPTLTGRSLRQLRPGVYSAARLNPPSGEDCTHLLVRESGSLGWCYPDGTQSTDINGHVSRFTVSDLLESD